MSTSLSTTLVGLIASVILKLQFFNLENIAKNRNEEKQSTVRRSYTTLILLL